MRSRRLVRVVGLVACLALLGGCATVPRLARKTAETVTWATWDHFAFSVKANWQIFHYWNATASRRDADTARRQGGWWGDEVPISDTE